MFSLYGSLFILSFRASLQLARRDSTKLTQNMKKKRSLIKEESLYGDRILLVLVRHETPDSKLLLSFLALWRYDAFKIHTASYCKEWMDYCWLIKRRSDQERLICTLQWMIIANIPFRSSAITRCIYSNSWTDLDDSLLSTYLYYGANVRGAVRDR